MPFLSMPGRSLLAPPFFIQALSRSDTGGSRTAADTMDGPCTGGCGRMDVLLLSIELMRGGGPLQAADAGEGTVVIGRDTDAVPLSPGIMGQGGCAASGGWK